jgi:hypothetical protein
VPEAPGLPPGNVTVTVTARDTLGTPVSGGKVMLMINSAFWELDVVTDADGRAQVTGGLEGVEAVVVSAANCMASSTPRALRSTIGSDFDVTFASLVHAFVGHQSRIRHQQLCRRPSTRIQRPPARHRNGVSVLEFR